MKENNGTNNDIKKEIGFVNEGRYCYLNSVIQCLFHERNLIEKILNYVQNFDINNNSILYNFINLYNQYNSTFENIITPKKFRENFGSQYTIFSQNSPQDAQEFMLYLLSCLNEEINILSKKNDNFINNLFNLTIETNLKCDICSWEKFLFEQNNNIVVDIPENNNSNFIHEMINIKVFLVKYNDLFLVHEFLGYSIPVKIDKNITIEYLKNVIVSSKENLDHLNLLSVLVNENKNILKINLSDKENIYPYLKKNNDILFYYFIDKEQNKNFFNYSNLLFIYLSNIVNDDFIFFYNYPIPIIFQEEQTLEELKNIINELIKTITMGEAKNFTYNIFHNNINIKMLFKNKCPICESKDNNKKYCELSKDHIILLKINNLLKNFEQTPINLLINIENHMLSLDAFQNIDNINEKKKIIFENIEYITLQDCLNFYNKEEILSDYICENCHNKGVKKKTNFCTNNLPEYLIIKINRCPNGEPGKNILFNMLSKKYQNKNDKFVSCPYNLDYFEGSSYYLCGIIDHVLNFLGSWHYYAKCRNKDGKWFLLDDNKVSEIHNNIINKDLYLLFYAKNN